MATLADLEARVAALEADRADYRAVLTAVGVMGQRVDGMTDRFDKLQQETREEFASVRTELALLKNGLSEHRQETRAYFRSTEEHFAELRDLIVNHRGKSADQH